MTRVLIASDSFKGSATSAQVAEWLSYGMLRADPSLEIDQVLIADGGEGTVESVLSANHGKLHQLSVLGPAAKETRAIWGMTNENIAVIESAQAVGITLSQNSMDPMSNTTYGVGQLIEEALNQNANKIYLGLGGSGTNDGGIGMAQAVGAHFYDEKNKEVSFGGANLSKISKIDLSEVDQRLKNVPIIGLSDVTNPLTGEKGATYIFAPQKGATEKQMNRLDAGLVHLNKLVTVYLKEDLGKVPGAGAAGGLGYGIIAFLQGRLESGIDGIMKLISLEKHISKADLVVTGEGKIDGQSLMGKAPIGIARIAKKYHKPVVAVTGSIGKNIESVYSQGIDLVLSTTNSPMTIQQAMKHADKLLNFAGYTVIKSFFL